MTKKKIWLIAVSALLLIAIAVGATVAISRSSVAEVNIETAQNIVNDQFDAMAGTKPLKAIAEKNFINVTSLSYGDEKDIILECTVDTIDAYSVISSEYNRFLSSDVKKKNGTMFKSALDFKLEFEDEITKLLQSAPKKSSSISIVLYDTKNGIALYSSDEVVNIVFGGIIDLKNEILGINAENVGKGLVECIQADYSFQKPDTANRLGRIINKIKKDFNQNFLEYDRWKTITTGLWTTIKLTILALIIGIILGFLVAFIRVTYIKTTKHGILLRILNFISELYLSITRGTPVVVQIMIIYFVIFMPIGLDKFIAAVICFGLNSGAYVAEIVRGGIMSVDDGQTEAGRSLGFNYMQTMWYIVFPQAFKAVLPALANEFVVLLKETSIAFYIGLGDLMYSVNAIRAATYSPFMPLVAAALIYLVMVLVLSKLVSILERRLRNSER
ncbi:MAG: amino acid ABC transporter permease [Monoglobales bacterium]